MMFCLPTDKQKLKRKRNDGFRKPRGWRRLLVINAEEAKIVRYIFDQFGNNDASIRGIARDLTEKKIESPDPRRRNKSGVWDKATVRKMMSCKAYIGYAYIGTINKDKKTKFGKITPTEVEGCVPVIVDRELFNIVQEKLQSNSDARKKQQPSRGGLLSGFLICANCKKRMYKATGQWRRKGRTDYVCNTVSKDVNCGCKIWRVFEEDILPKVTQWLVEDVDFEMLAAMSGRPEKIKIDEVDTLQKQIDIIVKKIDKGEENLLLADAENVPGLNKRLSEFRKELRQLEGRQALVRSMSEGGQLEDLSQWWRENREILITTPATFETEYDPECDWTIKTRQQAPLDFQPEKFRELLRRLDFKAFLHFIPNDGQKKYIVDKVDITASLNVVGTTCRSNSRSTQAKPSSDTTTPKASSKGSANRAADKVDGPHSTASAHVPLARGCDKGADVDVQSLGQSHSRQRKPTIDTVAAAPPSCPATTPKVQTAA